MPFPLGPRLPAYPTRHYPHTYTNPRLCFLNPGSHPPTPPYPCHTALITLPRRSCHQLQLYSVFFMAGIENLKAEKLYRIR